MNNDLRSFLNEGIEKGGFSPKEIARLFYPIFISLAAYHEDNYVAKDLIQNLSIVDGALVLNPLAIKQTQINQAYLIQSYHKSALPAYLPDYECEEINASHHDALSDVFVLGLLFSSFVLGLDLSKEEQVKRFELHLQSLTKLKPNLHPLLEDMVVEMTSLERKERAPDLRELAKLLQELSETNTNEYSSNETAYDTLGALRNRLFNFTRKSNVLAYKENAFFLNLSNLPESQVEGASLLQHIFNNEDFTRFTITNSDANEEAILTWNTLDNIRLKSNREKKEYDFSSLKLALIYLNWTDLEADDPGTKTSPLLFLPVQLIKDVKTQNFTIELLDRQAEFNPLLSYELKRIFNIQLPDYFDINSHAISDLQEQLQDLFDRAHSHIKLGLLAKNKDLQNALEWSLDLQKLVLGNFNYKRMSLVRDYDRLIEQKQLPAFLAYKDKVSMSIGSNEKIDNKSAFEIYKISETDQSQNLALQMARNGESFVIQGPPGTGKSQTISNVICDFIARDKKVLFVSEKPAALDAVYNKLEGGNLEHLVSFIHDAQLDKKTFIKDLHLNFEKNKQEEFNVEVVRRHRERLLAQIEVAFEQIQSYDHKLQTPLTEDGNVKFLDVMKAYIEVLDDLSKPEKESSFKQTISFQTWSKIDEALRHIYGNLEKQRFLKSFRHHPIAKISRTYVFSGLKVEALVESIKNLLEIIASCEACLEKICVAEFSNQSLLSFHSSLDNYRTLIYLSKQKQFDLRHPNTAQYQKFLDNLKMYVELEKKAYKLSQKTKHWRVKPREEDLESYCGIASRHEGKFLAIFNAEYRKLRSVFKKNYSSEFLDKEYTFLEALSFLKSELALSKEFEEFGSFCKLNYGNISLEDLHLKLKTLHQFTEKNKVTWVAELDEFSFENLEQFVNYFQQINTLATFIDWQSFESFDQLKNYLESLLLVAPLLEETKQDLARIYSFEEAYHFLMESEWNDRELKAAVLNQTVNVFLQDYPNFSLIDGKKIQHLTAELKRLNQLLLAQNVSCINAYRNDNFLAKLRVSNLSTSGLTGQEKNDRSQLQEGRKILENEFKKRQQFLSIRSLLASPALAFIQDLKPVNLMSPISVAETLPLQKDLFDLVIFDEASQCTLEEAIPAISRGSQIIVVGDSMQMPPNNLFKRRAWEKLKMAPLGESLLEQATNSLPELKLLWHYRSKHDSLINFNNSFFYDHELRTIPNVQSDLVRHPKIEIRNEHQAAHTYLDIFEKPLSFHYIQDAVYEERKNVREAKYIAELVKHLLLAHNDKSIGVIALSKEQQNAIQLELDHMRFFDKNFEELLREKQNKYPDFDGFMLKNLENIQGEERDIIIVSVGYGYNRDHKFLMNFGPINHKGGEKRLNVLFSRARQHMLMVSSIRYRDILIDYNPGAYCLKRYLKLAEEKSQGIDVDHIEVIGKNKVVKFGENTPVASAIKTALEAKSYDVQLDYGNGVFRCDLAVKRKKKSKQFDLAILLENLEEEVYQSYVFRKEILENFGWKVLMVYTKDWIQDSTKVLAEIVQHLEQDEAEKIALKEKGKNYLGFDYKLSDADLLYTRLEKWEEQGKFWQIAGKLNDLVIQYGKVGSEGKKLIKNYASVAEVIMEKRKLIKQKEKKGYKRV